MKKLTKVTLVSLESKELSQRQMSQVKGGQDYSCGCGCCYVNNGGSNTKDNGKTNCRQSLDSNPCNSPYWATWGCY